MADLVLAAVVATLGAVLLAGGGDINLGAGYDRIGPRFFPYAVGAGLVLLGAFLALASAIGRTRKRDDETPATAGIDWSPPGLIGIALLLNVLLLDRAGFVVACSIQFWLVARAFRSNRPIRDALTAVTLSFVVYFAFSRGLGVSLPAGILAGLS